MSATPKAHDPESILPANSIHLKRTEDVLKMRQTTRAYPTQGALNGDVENTKKQ